MTMPTGIGLVAAPKHRNSSTSKNIAVMIGCGLLLAGLALTTRWSPRTSLLQKQTDILPGRQSALYSWSNEFDDGKGVLHGQQHGITETISGCDADDPACSFHVRQGDSYAQGEWRGEFPRPTDVAHVQVQHSHILPSTWEDDVREGDAARIARTDSNGEFSKRPLEQPEYDVVGVRRGDGSVYRGDVYAQRDAVRGEDEGDVDAVDKRQWRAGEHALRQGDGGSAYVQRVYGHEDQSREGGVHSAIRRITRSYSSYTRSAKRRQQSRDSQISVGRRIESSDDSQEGRDSTDEQATDGGLGVGASAAAGVVNSDVGIRKNTIVNQLRKVSMRVSSEEGVYSSLDDKLRALHERAAEVSDQARALRAKLTSDISKQAELIKHLNGDVDRHYGYKVVWPKEEKST